jgi:hypothetical protein
VVNCAFHVIEVKEAHPKKVYVPMLVIVDGRVKLVKPVVENADPLIVVTVAGKEKLCRAEQPSKQPAGIVSKVAFHVALLKLELYLNIKVPIVVTLLGIVVLVILVL